MKRKGDARLGEGECWRIAYMSGDSRRSALGWRVARHVKAARSHDDASLFIDSFIDELHPSSASTCTICTPRTGSTKGKWGHPYSMSSYGITVLCLAWFLATMTWPPTVFSRPHLPAQVQYRFFYSCIFSLETLSSRAQASCCDL